MGLNDISTKIITLSVCAVMIVAFAVPVIASLNGGGGGGETVTYRNDSGDLNFYYRSIDAITDDSAFTILPVWDESAGMSDPMFLETYPDGSEIPIKWDVPHDVLFFNESAFINKVYIGGNSGTQTAYFNYNNASQRGNTLQYYDGQFHIPLGSGVVVMTPIPDVAYFSWYEGDYVCSFPDDDTSALPNRYVDSSTEIYWTGIYNGKIQICVTGSADNPKALYYDFSAEEYGTADSVVFNVENDVLRSISVVVQGMAHTIWVTYTTEEAESEIDWDIDLDGWNCIVPTTVTVSHGSGSGSSGLDGTLGTLVSVIPLLMVVGLVTVAVAMFVRKD